LYNSDYADRIAALKSERGVSTKLDELAVDLRGALEQDGASRVLHDVPLYFAAASFHQMFAALDAVVLEGYGSDALDENARSGFEIVATSYRLPRQRRVLQVLLDALRDEWDNFYSEYREDHAASSTAAVDIIGRQWTIDFAPAMHGFLRAQGLESGVILLSPALNPRGRLFIYSGDTLNTAVVWLPEDEEDYRRVGFAIVRELCSVAVGNALRAPNIEGSVGIWENATVRCGEMVLEREDEGLARAYSEAFLLSADVPSDRPFAQAFPINNELEQSLRAAAGGDGVVVDDFPGLPTSGWMFRPRATADLWYHALAVIAADQPGPLGMYSADYANHIRDVKRELGVYPTRLDSLTADLNKLANGGGDRDMIHFMPIYFPDKNVKEMLNALLTPRHTDVVRAFGRQPDGRTQDAIRQLAEVMVNEWEVFYRDYWNAQVEANRDRYAAVQEYWDRVLGPILTPYLEERRLQGGLVMPSIPVGPEGRIINPDPFDGRDQVVAMWFPLTANTPEVSNFFFLKELCFLIVNDNAYGRFGVGTQEFDDLRRTGAVRCGAMILDEYSPVLALQYRRTFLDAVGAEESATMEAFDRVYYLDPAMLARLQAQVTMPR
ncbi:MAG: hypothetical protein V3T56_08665, partial [Gemmatimonadales bacterium]